MCYYKRYMWWLYFKDRAVRPCTWMKDNIILTKGGYGRNEKRFSTHTRGVLCLSSYETDEYFVRFRANAQDPSPPSSHFLFSYVDTRWSCSGPTSSSGGLVQTALWGLAIGVAKKFAYIARYCFQPCGIKTSLSYPGPLPKHICIDLARETLPRKSATLIPYFHDIPSSRLSIRVGGKSERGVGRKKAETNRRSNVYY